LETALAGQAVATDGGKLQFYSMKLRVTVKQMADAIGISERMVYIARRLDRSGRKDLVAAVKRGEIKLHEALRVADGKPKPTSFARLVTACNRSSNDERQRFLSHVGATAPLKAARKREPLARSLWSSPKRPVR
jgi:hypothetical protein